MRRYDSIKTEELNNILAKYGIKFKDTIHYRLALTHSSYANEHNLTSNERIEFLGDAILGLLVAEYMYSNFSDMHEGAMSKLRATYVCEDANAKYARAMGIDKLLLLGRGEEATGGRNRDAILSDAFESFLGAVYLSNGLKDVKKILEVEVFPLILAREEKPFVDYKSRLQEYVQAEQRSDLSYVVDDIAGPPHKRVFTMSVMLEGIRLGTGTGSTKKDASQEAARVALEKMAVND